MTTQTRCRAADPSTCWRHGTPNHPDGLDKAALMQDVIRTQAERVGTHPAIMHALQSPLTPWVGAKPKWWKKYVEETSKSKMPVEPELLDVIQTPDGEQIAVVWEEDSQAKGDLSVGEDSGMQVHRLRFMNFDSQADIGYLKTTHVDDASFARSFGDDEFAIFRWHSRFSGSFRYYTASARRNNQLPTFTTGAELEAERRKVWVQVAKDQESEMRITDSNGNPVYPWNVNESHVPVDPQQVKADIERYKTGYLGKKLAERRKYYDAPFVDFSRVEEMHRGKGLGTSLYIYMARSLALRGKALRGSSLQTEEAQSTWGRFQKNFPHQVKPMKLTWDGEKKTFYTFDFR